MRLLIVMILSLVLTGCGGRSTFYDMDSRVWLPLTWAQDPDGSLAILDKGGLDDPLLFGMWVVSALSSANISQNDVKLEVVRTRFDQFMETRNEHGYWHHEAYYPFPTGWYSGMDFSSMALAAEAIYARTNDTRYRQAGIDLIAQMILPVEQGGTIHATDKGACWLGEYVWPDMSEDDETYVLNGSLYALHALEYFAALDLDRPDFDMVLECAKADMVRISDEYFFDDDRWSYYMLKDNITNQAHYLIYETNQFDALYLLTGDDFYREQADRRRAIFQREYPVYKTPDRFMFVGTGTPHPFRPDVYGTQIEFLDEGGRVLEVIDTANASETPDRFFTSGALPVGSHSVVVTTYSGASSIEMYRGPMIEASEDYPRTLIFRESPIFDAVSTGDTWMLRPGDKDPRLMLHLDRPLTKEDFTLFAIDAFFSEGTAWAIGLNDSAGEQLFRYLPKLPGGGHLITPVSWLGFNEPEKLLEDVVSITLYFYPEAPMEVRVNSVKLYPDYHALGKDLMPNDLGRLMLKTH